MISLLVSSKTMQPNPCPFKLRLSDPLFLQQAIILNGLLRSKSPKQLIRLMHISPKLAEATAQNVQAWQATGGTPAWYTFIGDVYKGLKIQQFSAEDLAFAQQHMGTISGLYGILRPLDTIHPYRLELMYKLTGKGFTDLYQFWGESIARTIADSETVINLASEEYIKVLRPYLAIDQIITPWFMQTKNGRPDFQAIHAKIARGAMARWIAKNRIDSPAQLRSFDYNGYTYRADLSTLTKPVFTRPEGYDFKADY